MTDDREWSDEPEARPALFDDPNAVRAAMAEAEAREAREQLVEERLRTAEDRIVAAENRAAVAEAEVTRLKRAVAELVGIMVQPSAQEPASPLGRSTV